MIGFQEYLKQKGFKDYRRAFLNKKWVLVSHSECGINENGFSTMITGGLDIVYIKDGVEVIYGLNEYKKPPTLIFPRPFIYDLELSKKNIYMEVNDDLMNRALKKYSNDEIYEAMFNKKIHLAV